METIRRGWLAPASLTIIGIVVLTLAGAAAALAAPIVTGPGDQTTVEGSAHSFSLGSFTDSNPGPFDGTVNWGDGTLSGLLPSLQGSLGSLFHNYGEEGSYTVIVTVRESGTGLQGLATFSVTGSDPAVIGTGVAVSGVEGTPFTGDVATFTDPGGVEPNASDPTGTIANHYAATINWGDGSTSLATLVNPFPVFDVHGIHTYATNGTFTITTDINHEGVVTETRSTATIAAVPEPATVGLLGLGILGLLTSGWRRR